MTELYRRLCELFDRIGSGNSGRKITVIAAVAIWLAVTAWQVMKILR